MSQPLVLERESRWRLRLSTAVLFTVGLVDLISTLAWFEMGGREGNPTFARLWEFGPAQFVAGKLLFLVGPVAILEIVRKYRPTTAEQGTWVAVAAYLVLWLASVGRIGGII